MVVNPERFCQKSSENTEEYIWGFHHEDWQRAYALIVFVKSRRIKTTEVPERGPMQYIGVRGKTDKSEIYSFASLDVLSTVDGLDEDHYSGAAVELARERAILDPQHDGEAMKNLAERGTNEQIARALDAIDSVRKKPQSLRESLIENDDGALEDIISEEIVNTLHAIAPGIDLSRALSSTVPKAKQRKEITCKEREALASLFREALRIYTPPSPTSNSSDGNRYQELQTITTAGDVTGLADESGTISDEQHIDTEFESLRNMRALLGENVPENQDLEEICKLRGIDIDTLAVNSHNPRVTAKAPQIPDANKLAELLTSEMHAAMLLSECGTGKTFVTLLTLKFLLEERIKAFKKGALKVPQGDRIFKPSIIFVPSAALNQFFSEANSDWAGFFDIYSFYQTRANCNNPDRQNKTIDTLEQLQEHINVWAKNHEDPDTGRVILLTAYSTATRRLLGKRASVKLNREQMDLLSSQGDIVDYDSQDDELAGVFEPDDECEVEDGAPPKGDNASAYIKRRRKVLVNDMWNAVVCDECHQIKNSGTDANKLVRQLDRDALLLVSATPLPNHVRDIQGYLRVLWDPAWPFGYQQKGDETSPDSFLGELVYDSLFDGSIDLQVEDQLTLKRVLTGRVKPSAELTPRQKIRSKEYKKFVTTHKGPAYLINPNLFMAYAKTHNYGTCVSTLAVSPILKLLSVRRGMLTQMTLPDGRVTFMGEGISGFNTETIEFEPSAQVKERLASFITILADKLMSPIGVGPPEMLTGGHLVEKAGIMLNSAVYRRLSLASTDVNNITLTTPSARLLQRLSDLRQGTAGEVPQVMPLAHHFDRRETRQDEDSAKGVNTMDTDNSGLPEYQRRREARKARLKPIPAAGVKEVNQIAVFDTTGGLQWNFYNTRSDQKFGFPTDRVNQIRYVAWDSPKYMYTILEALDAQSKGERLLIYTNNPLTSQIVNALLVAAGVPTLHYMSRNSQAERDQAVEAFNNPASPYTCLVTSLQLLAFGVGFHRACHRGLILEYPMNHAILLQAQGRLWRIGQQHDVQWKILYSRNSFDCYIESRNLEKYSTTLAAEGNIDPKIRGEARIICAFEIMRRHLGQACSRYSRARVPWSEMDSPQLEQEGAFYFALAEFFFKYPGKSEMVGKHNIKDIAKAWIVGQRITPRMISAPVPKREGLELEGYKNANDAS
ncbi:P-loop containing nucleoside triphosphate hydrolase protein [Trichoderma velutinum]